MRKFFIICHRGLLPENWRFYCAHCQQDHVHGAREGLRSSHCRTPTSPFYKETYFIVLLTSDWYDRWKAGELQGRPWLP